MEENMLQPLETRPIFTAERSFDEMLAYAEKFVVHQDKIRKLAIKVTNQGDWINQNGVPYLEWTGAAKIAGTFGVSYDQPMIAKDVLTDEDGDYTVFTVSGTVRCGARSMHEIGTSSSRDAFFAKSGGTRKPPKEIDLNNVKKKAMTNWLNRALKSLLGLSYTWEEVEQHSDGKINRGGGATVTRTSAKADLTPEQTQKRDEISKWMKELYGDQAPQKLKEMTAFTTGEGKAVDGKTSTQMLSGKQIDRLHPIVKKEHGDA